MMFSSFYHRIDSEFLLLLELKCFVHTFYNCIGSFQSGFKCMKRSMIFRKRVSTTLKGHSGHHGLGSTRVVVGGGDVNGLQKHMYIIYFVKSLY